VARSASSCNAFAIATFLFMVHSVFSAAVSRARSVRGPEAGCGHYNWNRATTRDNAQSASGSVSASCHQSTTVSYATRSTIHQQLQLSYVSVSRQSCSTRIRTWLKLGLKGFGVGLIRLETAEHQCPWAVVIVSK